jgi:catechol 2,3-dioxygenase-like lactoylglutathione lyase family enzyme
VIAFPGTTDPEHARVFMEVALGLRRELDEPFALVFDANGTMLRLSEVETLTPAPFTVPGWRVTDIESIMNNLLSRGARFERFARMNHDEHGICTFPDGDRVAWFKDPDGNKILSLTQFS